MIRRASSRRSHAAVRWLYSHRLVLGVGVGAALPVIISTIRGLAEGWIPSADEAAIAVRAYDVLSTHPPLVGQFSNASDLLHRAVYSPGPILYWLLAIPAHFLPTAAIPLLLGGCNVAAIVCSVVLARRRGGLGLMFATAIAIALMCMSLQSQVFHDDWNPSVALLPLVLMSFLSWSVACGDYRLLPLLVLVATWEIQNHLVYVLPVSGMLAVSFGGLGVQRGWWASALRRHGMTYELRPGFLKRTVWASLAVIAVCWALPLADQLLYTIGSGHGKGNLGAIAQAAFASAPRLGFGAAWHIVARSIGIPPLWLRPSPTSSARILDALDAPHLFTTVTGALVFGALLATLYLGLRRRRVDISSAAAIAIVLCIALAVDAESIPKFSLSVADYTLWWDSVVGMWTWLVLGWSAVVLWHRLGRRAPLRAGAPAVVVVCALAMVVTVGAAVGLTGGHDESIWTYQPLRTIVAALDAAVPSGRTVLVSGSASERSIPLQEGVIYALRRHNDHPLTGLAELLGSFYTPDHRQHLTISVNEGTIAPPHSGRVVARLAVGGPDPGPITVTVSSLHTLGFSSAPKTSS